MRKQVLIIPYAALVLILSLTCFAQDNRNDSSQLGKVIAEPFTSFENTSVEFEEAVLDTFAVALLNSPDQIGYIIVYAGRRACAGEAQVRAMRMKKYLVKYRGIEWNRVIWKDAGHLERPYVVLEMQLRGVEPYPFTRPEVLPTKVVRIVNCKVKNNRRKSRSKSKAAPNKSFERSANSAAFIRQLEGLIHCVRARSIQALCVFASASINLAATNLFVRPSS